MNRLTAVFLFFQLIVIAANARQRDLQFARTGIRQGLSHSNVINILQDRKGFLWFGTRDGLNKYDGYKFTIYKNRFGDENSLSQNMVNDLAEDSEGNIWIATWGGGINKYDPKHNTFTCYRHDKNDPYSISSDLVHSIEIDANGNLWIGTDEPGLYLFDIKREVFVDAGS